ncbi:SunI/YnzG family protein [Bacillus thuringiensis]
MLGIDVKKTKEELIISWQLAKITIPLRDVIEVTEDATYAGIEDTSAIRIGTAYGTTDCILIKTVKQNLILFAYPFTVSIIETIPFPFIK